MVQRKSTGGFSRRRVLQGAAVIGASQAAAPFIVPALGETPVKIGLVDPLTGSLSLDAVPEVEGAKYAVAEINKKGGILGRQVQLFVEDSANDVGTGVQKIRKLIDKDHVNVTMGDVNSGIAYAISQVATQKGVLHIVPGGHTDPITGKSCAWNVFRVCNTTMMDAGAATGLLIKKYGKRWFMITPDYAYGHSLKQSFAHYLAAAGGTYENVYLPISTSDFSSTLIKAKAYKPDVLINNMGGLAQVDLAKQFVQFGMNKDMGLGGTLFELESILAVPREAQVGVAVMEWWWDQPGVPYVAEFVAGIKKTFNKPASSRHWFTWVAVNSVKQAAEKAKSLDGLKMAKAMEGMVLPPEVALQKKEVFYRAGDHELMPTLFAGTVHPPAKDSPYDVFTPELLVDGEKILPLADTGCHMKFPA